MSTIRKQSFKSTTPALAGGIALTAISVIVGAAVFNTVTQEDSAAEAPVVVTQPVETVEPEDLPIVERQVGTGAAEILDVMYSVPRNHVSYMDIFLSFENEIITDVEIKHRYDSVSEEHVAAFDAEIQNRVVGRSLDNVDDSLIGDASLTSNAFFDALRDVDINDLDQSRDSQVQSPGQ